MTSIILWFIWMTGSFVYYGIVFMTTELFETPDMIGFCKASGSPESTAPLNAGNWIDSITPDYSGPH
ncbi:Uncharacterized protein FKW44_009581 [Caligus rogercresseyi]|uniref:Uncharacterized protein n=1 Tax=Caligus rogercresseyi TaxID=217165 RepID=A0A7T8HFD6_CALRO|nr:Uncharacterized protein FKW44_009581 [Caligus rogercresseyi]